MSDSPLLHNKHYASRSVFLPQNLLREARRQKGVPEGSVPKVCVLDPDGDIVRMLVQTGRGRRSTVWPCYHTDLYETEWDGISMGIVGCAVGASFAVLVAEEFFACGCELLVSITSAGQLSPVHPPPYFVLIDRALRDEGTSHHYLPPSPYAMLAAQLIDMLAGRLDGLPHPVETGGAWTTDAPFRETEESIAFACSEGLLAVEMEAAALYAFAEARRCPVVCMALVTNQMATTTDDFEKGRDGGASASLALVARIATIWKEHNNEGISE